jgi:hypothetical protein
MIMIRIALGDGLLVEASSGHQSRNSQIEASAFGSGAWSTPRRTRSHSHSLLSANRRASILIVELL